MSDPDYEGAIEQIDAIARGVSKLAANTGPLDHRDFAVDKQFFAIVKSRADRVRKDCGEGRRRNRAMSSATEIPALLNQATADLRAARQDVTAPNELDALADRAAALASDASGLLVEELQQMLRVATESVADLSIEIESLRALATERAAGGAPN